MSLSFVAGLRRIITLAFLTASFTFVPLGAQTAPAARNFLTGMRTGIGYTGVMPDAILGAGAFHLVGDGPTGVFADGSKTTFTGIRKDDRYCPPAITECTVAWVLDERNDQHVDDAKEWLVFNAGIVYAATPEFAFLLGGGLARKTRFQEFFDDNDDAGQRVTGSGSYFVDDDPTEQWTVQAVGGFLLRAGPSLVFRVGYQTAIGGLALGAYCVLP